MIRVRGKRGTKWQLQSVKTGGAGKELLTEVIPETLQRKGDFVSKNKENGIPIDKF